MEELILTKCCLVLLLHLDTYRNASSPPYGASIGRLAYTDAPVMLILNQMKRFSAAATFADTEAIDRQDESYMFSPAVCLKQ